MKTIHLFANWKMYLGYDESNILANALIGEVRKMPPAINIALFPSALSLYSIALNLKETDIAVGAQNAYWLDKGGYTGEVSVGMFKEVGCRYVLIGHSERRHVFHETNLEVRKKVEAAFAEKIMPVVCVGETKEERNAGKTEEVVEVQLRAAFEDLNLPSDTRFIIAYEPVWAIGTGDACDPKEAERIHKEIAKITKSLLSDVNFSILYGGSVRAENVADYLAGSHTDGVLIGNASAKLDTFKGIMDKAAQFAAK
ncbi:MAG: triose-phosphate isomerase [Candidatus Magasanikbacteria bacterium]|nr:triose-phosphate isomerase [Candidatus Magasanikbacteria bacterium]